jgi:LemA protein
MLVILVLIVSAVAVIYAIATFNRLILKRNQFKNAFAQIDVQLERRYDLIPNLVEIARKYMQHESETLEAVVRARNDAQAACRSAVINPENASAVHKLSQTETNLSQTLGRFLMLTENYPELKAHVQMNSLMEELSNTENLVAFARQAYNDSVMSYNSECQKFPANFFATMFGFTEATFLKLQIAEKRSAPTVKF